MMAVHRLAAARRRRRAPRRTAPVTVTRVDPQVWRIAIRLAKGDMGRLRVVDSTSVVVINVSRYARIRGGEPE